MRAWQRRFFGEFRRFPTLGLAVHAASVVAVDLGASSGRTYLGVVNGTDLEMRPLSRFPNRGVEVAGTLYWDILGIYRGLLDGVGEAARVGGRIESIGIDSWAVDFGLLDRAGTLLANPVHHRDARTIGVVDDVLAKIPIEDLYARTGIQLQRFNTLFQLVAASTAPYFDRASTLLLIPDLLNFWLTGEARTEVTNASTTQLLRADRIEWDAELAATAGIDLALFPPLVPPGDVVGRVLPDVLDATGLSGSVQVTAVASHDTASAVVAVPAANKNFAYISCGTWSLVGLELDAPMLTAASREANFTNERGIDGTTRFLRNVMGLWLLQESMRTWERAGHLVEVDELVRDAGRVGELTFIVDADDPQFLAPGDMPARIAAACASIGGQSPRTPAEVTRCILDSLALAYARSVDLAKSCADREVEVIHLVGGGSQNALLCQLTADACGVPVVAGPVEAAAIGNVLVQARSLGVVSGGLDELRRVVRMHERFTTYEPRPNRHSAWSAAESRLPRTT